MATPIPSNRCAFTLAEAEAATGGKLMHAAAQSAVIGVSIDTRTLSAGALFVALRGTSADGHAHLPQAAARGAAAAIVARGHAIASLPCIEVDDTLDALGMLARHHLRRTRAARALPTIAIGGAAGKTTTKELTAAASRATFGPTLSTPGNLNNRIGVPMSIFTLTGGHRAAVLECGTNMSGEIARLADVVEPDVAMVLNVDIEHSEGLGTIEQIADEEAQLFSTARRFAVASTGQPLVMSRIPPRLGTITFGTSPDADVRLARRSVLESGRSRIALKLNPLLVKSEESSLLVVEISLLGAAMALNYAAALAGVIAMSPEPLSGDQLRAVGDVFAAALPVPRRLALTTMHGMVVIDDSYNAQPPSMRVAIATARELAEGSGARLVMVLGDMLELGPLSASSHDEAVRTALEARPALLVAVGPEMTAAMKRASAASVEVSAAGDSEEASKLVAASVRPGDVVLVKGSLGMAMDRVISRLQAL
ncbi:MAG: UDP-N-acetylmuramoyl-tripeptide--D-alanyl-D-alanine ligase [Candidatus Binataceae bacterium]